jgi:hypothetical protein
LATQAGAHSLPLLRFLTSASGYRDSLESVESGGTFGPGPTRFVAPPGMEVNVQMAITSKFSDFCYINFLTKTTKTAS